MPDTGLENTRLRDIGITALYAVIVAILLRVFVIGAYEIPSHSMENSLLAGDYIVVSKITYLLRDVRRGDVVIFKYQDSSQVQTLFVKRVVGVAGDTLVFTKDAIIVNGIPQPTPPDAKIPTSPLLSSMKPNTRMVIGRDSVFVVGDNRRNSYDSRYWGSVHINDIKGSPLFIYWSYGPTDAIPLDHIRWGRMFGGIH